MFVNNWLLQTQSKSRQKTGNALDWKATLAFPVGDQNNRTKMISKFSASVTLSVILVASVAIALHYPAEAYNDQVYNSLLRTRDALIDQKKSIEQAIEQTRKKIDALNAHLKTLEDYLKQTDSDIKDVDRALRNG